MSPYIWLSIATRNTMEILNYHRCNDLRLIFNIIIYCFSLELHSSALVFKINQFRCSRGWGLSFCRTQKRYGYPGFRWRTTKKEKLRAGINTVHRKEAHRASEKNNLFTLCFPGYRTSIFKVRKRTGASGNMIERVLFGHLFYLYTSCVQYLNAKTITHM